MGKYRNSIKSLIALCAFVLFTGCVSQTAELVYTVPESQETPNPASGRDLMKLNVPDVTGAPVLMDAMGVPVLDEDAHYYKLYVSFTNIRVYEEDGHTYLDAVAVNGYGRTLSGGLDIVFPDGEGGSLGRGTLHTAAGGLVLAPGSTRVYAEIEAETDVRLAGFTFDMTAPFVPLDA